MQKNIATIIQITEGKISENVVQTVNARDLHAFLESKQDFSTWIKGRIDQYNFIEGGDFTLHKFVERGTTKIDYHVSIDMAKELSMVERNAKGKEARQYFIECEKKLKQADPMEILGNPVLLRQTLLGYSEKVIALENANAEMTPKVEALDRISTANGSLCITDAAKSLQVQPKKLFQLMNQKGWIYRRTGKASWIAHQEKIKQLLLEHKITTVERDDGTEKITEQVRVTPKGMTRLALLVKELEAA